jgi:hypothetical protein
MVDYHSIIARAVSHLPSTADEARYAIYEQARTALHERLGNDPQISDTELVNEHAPPHYPAVTASSLASPEVCRYSPQSFAPHPC